MSTGEDPMQSYHAADQAFMDSLPPRGIEIDGVRAAFTPCKGRGIVADRHIKEGDLLVHVPVSAILVNTKTAARNAAKDSTSSVHSLLTLKLLKGNVPEEMTELLLRWRTMMPHYDILKECVPLLWPGKAQQLLPEPAKAMLQRQRKKFARDWNDFRSLKLSPQDIGLAQGAGQSTIYEAYAHAWLLINTRSFYWDYPTSVLPKSKGAKQKAKKSASDLTSDDCMALVPFIDLFNHTYAGESCAVEFDYTGFTVSAIRDYEPGEEVFVTYGNHGNEFLLVEYGFMMEPNVVDTVSLDQYVIPEFSQAQRALLEDKSLFGNYNLHASQSPNNITPPTYCHRTECALRALTIAAEAVDRYIETGGESASEETEAEKLRIYNMWKHICGHIFAYILKNKNAVETELPEGLPQEILLARWNQISDMVNDTLQE